MLLGEHSVVYGYPCLVTAVEMRLTVEIGKTGSSENKIEVPEGSDTRFVDAAIKAAGNAWNTAFNGLSIKTSCKFCKNYGFGSSSAVSAAMIYGLAKVAGKELAKQEIFQLAYQSVLDVQGVGSGFDVAAAVWGGTIYYAKGQPVVPVSCPGLPLVVGYTGVKADTVTIVKEIAEKKNKNNAAVTRIFGAITEIVTKAKGALEQSDWQTVGKYFNFNQEYLRDLGVSSDKLEAMINAANSRGAYGAKLSGAGRGDCMIAVVPDDKKKDAEDAITESGGEIVRVNINAEGVREETA